MKKEAVLITGAAGGIGQALVKAFKDSGYAVVGTDSVSTAAGCDAYVQLDLKELISDEGKAKELKEAFKDYVLKGLVNNAAVQLLGGVADASLSDFQETFDVNVKAPFCLTRIFLNDLEKNKGAVVNIGSIHSRLTCPNFVSYATSKAALLGLTKAMAVDLGARIRVNIIHPAATETEMLVAGFEGDREAFEKLGASHPLGRIAKPEEIATAAVFLISDNASFVSGGAIDIDGGIGARLNDPK